MVLTAANLGANIKKFLKTKTVASVRSDDRNASFDYCFNYLQSFRERKKFTDLTHGDHLEKSCLQLGFYLASWGMFRNSFLLDKSSTIYKPVIEIIAQASPDLWRIDVHRYTPANIDQLLRCKARIAAALPAPRQASDNLVSKIMLGTFGNVPAFDTNFTKGLDSTTFCRQALDTC